MERNKAVRGRSKDTACPVVVRGNLCQLQVTGHVSRTPALFPASIDNRSEPIPFSPFPPFLPSDLYCPRTNFCVQSRGLLISVLITNLSARGTVPFSHEIGHHANLANATGCRTFAVIFFVGSIIK